MRCSLLLLLAGSTSALGCSAVLGITDVQLDEGLEAGADSAPKVDSAPAPDVAAQGCPASSETDECFKCTDENCCVEYAACAADPRCGDYYKQCLPSCKAAGKPYSTCVVECDKTNGAGLVLFAPYFACGQLHCLARCSNSAPDLCTQCMYGSCRDEAYACDKDRDCMVLNECVVTCLGLPNYDACAAACTDGKSAAAKQKFSVRNACLLQYCGQTCG
jgi:hypothetical protein